MVEGGTEMAEEVIWERKEKLIGTKMQGLEKEMGCQVLCR